LFRVYTFFPRLSQCRNIMDGEENHYFFLSHFALGKYLASKWRLYTNQTSGSHVE